MPRNELDELERWAVAAIEAALGHSRVYNSFRAVPKADHSSVGFVVMRFVPGVRQNVRVQGPTPIMVKPNYDVTVVVKGSPTDVSEEMVRKLFPGPGVPAPLGPEPPAESGDFLISGAAQYALSYESQGLIAEDYFSYRGQNVQFWMTRKSAA